MKEILNNEALGLLFEKAVLFLNHIFPGMFLLELFFDKGIFSNTPQTIFELSIYIIWSIILSIPLSSTHISILKLPFKMESDFKKLINKKLPKHKITKEQFDVYSTQINSTKEHMKLGWVLIKLSIIYIIYKALSYYTDITFFNIHKNIIELILTMLSTYLLTFPLGYIYTHYISSKSNRLMSSVLDHTIDIHRTNENKKND